MWGALHRTLMLAFFLQATLLNSAATPLLPDVRRGQTCKSLVSEATLPLPVPRDIQLQMPHANLAGISA